MNWDRSPGKIRRLIFILSGATDAFVGAAVLLIGFGILPVDIVAIGLPGWLLVLIGAIMFIAGVGVTIYNFSRLEE